MNLELVRYMGLKTMELSGIKRDYLYISIEMMIVYVPMEQIDLVLKYGSADGSNS